VKIYILDYWRIAVSLLNNLNINLVMDIQEITNRINENSRLLAEGNISEIERDILLDDLRSLYLLAKGNITKPIRPEVIAQPKAVVETKPIEIIKEEPIAPVIEQKPIEVPEVMKEKKEPVEISKPIKNELPVIEFVKQEEGPKTTATSLNERFAGEEKSLNKRLSGDKKVVLNDHAGRKDLKSMIDFNKQYILTNELFKGDSQAFQAAISHINEAPTIEAAFEFIKTDLMPKYKWNSELQSTRLFDKLVRQKFGST
jgi:hypothetical protein